jgi:serine phosphatase RsbU (regulator of sigma subunit)
MPTPWHSRAGRTVKALLAVLCGGALSLAVSGISGAVSLPVSSPLPTPTVAVPALTTPGASVPLPGSVTVSIPSLTTPAVSVPTGGEPTVSAPPGGQPTVSVPTPSMPAVPPLPIAAGSPLSPSPASAHGAGSAGTGAGRSSPGSTGQRSQTPRGRPRGGHSTNAARRPRVGARTPSGPGVGTPAAAKPPHAGLLTAAPSAAKPPSHPSASPLDSIGSNIPLPLPVPDWSKPIILVLLLVAIGLGARSRLASRRAGMLERQRATLLRDLDVMQSALVPDLPSEVGGMRISAAYRAAEGPGAGGDFYDVFALESGRVAVILGDVVGHGHEALTDAALTRYTLRAYLQAGLDPRATLALASRVLTEPETERYVTVVVGLFDSDSGELTYATAGHPTPIILGSHEPPAITGCPALSCGLPTGRRQTRVSLTPGAQVCFFSDGLIEARVQDGLFGRERLRAMLPSLGPRPLADELLHAIRAEADACHDDMSVCIVLPRSSSKRAATYVEEFEADVRALAGGQAEHFLEACSVPQAAIAGTLERASAIAVADGSAMLRVDIHAAGSAVAVSGHSARARAEGEYRPASCAPAAMHPSSA